MLYNCVHSTRSSLCINIRNTTFKATIVFFTCIWLSRDNVDFTSFSCSDFLCDKMTLSQICHWSTKNFLWKSWHFLLWNDTEISNYIWQILIISSFNSIELISNKIIVETRFNNLSKCFTFQYRRRIHNETWNNTCFQTNWQ